MNNLGEIRAARLSNMDESTRADYEAGYEDTDEGIRISQIFYDERKSLGLTQSELARRIKVSQSTVASVETSAARPSKAVLE